VFDCCPSAWIGDGFCDGEDQISGCNLNCAGNAYDGGDCDDDANSCADAPGNCETASGDWETCFGGPADQVACEDTCDDNGGTWYVGEGYVEDCSEDGDCAPEAWIGDGWCDGEDEPYGYDLTCYENDGGDCDRGISEGTPNRDAYWIPDTERYTEMISSGNRAASTFCDEQSYQWFYTKGSAAAFNYLDLNSNGIYDIGERFSLIDNNAIVQEFTPEEFWDDNESGFWDVDEEYVDENGNGIYDVGTDLGDYLPPNQEEYLACGDSCTPGSFDADGDTEAVGYFGHGRIDLHAEFRSSLTTNSKLR
jgi:hypothetical protein